MRILLYFTLLRPRQVIKNGFVLAPIFFAGDIFSANVVSAIIGFICFALVSSTIYVINDYCDREADRQHPKKKSRPIASGAVSTVEVVIILLSLIVSLLAILGSWSLPIDAIIVLCIYVLVNLTYSFGLKNIAVLELMVLASGFVLRLIFGALIVDVQLSPWIIVCTGVLALMITVGKRRSDIVNKYDEKSARRSLAGYNIQFLDQLNSILATTTLAAYLIFCASDYAIGRFGQQILLTAPFVFYGIIRYLQLVTVGQLGDDPTTLIITDRGIRIAFGAWVLCFIGIIYFRLP